MRRSMITIRRRISCIGTRRVRHKSNSTVTHSTPSLALHLRMSPEHAPVPPRPREVLEPGPAHGHAQPSARAARRHGGVVRLEGRPAVGREGSDVIRALHVSARFRPARVRRTRRRVCGASGDACVARRGGAGPIDALWSGVKSTVGPLRRASSRAVAGGHGPRRGERRQ